MKRQMKREYGITLIALVISIIVMLILAGVSLNMTVGDNGLITRAQEATKLQQCAELEEFLNEFYASNYDDLPQDARNKAEALQNYYKSKDWIYNPSLHGVGTMSYVINKEGDVCYFIDKDNFEKSKYTELKLRNGSAIDGSYLNYFNMIDVYGVTGDLKVYYCGNGKTDMINMASEELDSDDASRVVYEKGTAIAKLLNDGDITKPVTSSEARSITSIEITDEISDFNELFYFSNLATIKLKSYTGSLDGIQNLPLITKLYMYNCSLEDYSYLGGLSNRLTQLLLIRMDKGQLELLCSNDKGIANCDFKYLTHFGFCSDNFDTVALSYMIGRGEGRRTDTKTNLQTIDCLTNLSKTTKESIRYLLLHNNAITDISKLKDFKNVYWLRIEGNNIKSLKGLETLSDLTYLFAPFNNLGVTEGSTKNSSEDSLSSLSSLTKLYYIDLYNNDNLKFVSYLANKTSIAYLNLYNNANINSSDIALIKSVLTRCGGNGKVHPKYSLSLLDENTTILDLSGQKVNKDDFEGLKTKTKITRLNINSLVLTNDSGGTITNATEINKSINDTLSALTNLEYLSARNISQLTTIDFAKKTPKLKELIILGTGITNLKNLNDITTMATLAIDNTSIELSGANGIETTISRLHADSFWDSGMRGLVLNNATLAKKLEGCTAITNLYMYQHNYQIWVDEIDLKSCTNLTNIDICRVTTKFILPSSIIRASCTYQSGIWDFSRCTKIQSFSWVSYVYNSPATMKSFLSTLANKATLKSISIGFSTQCSDLSFLTSLTGCTGLETLYLHGCFSSDTALLSTNGIETLTTLKWFEMSSFLNLKELKGLDKLTRLETLSISSGKIQDLTNVGKLTQLNHLNITSNNISNVYPLLNLKHLGEKVVWVDSNGNDVYGYVNLRGNPLTDYSSYYQDDSGKTVSVSTLNVFVQMKQNNPSLQNLYLTTNSGIIDFSPLTNIGWDTSGKFNN